MNVSIENRHFLLRKLHSLFGVLPIGGFLVFHLWENSQSRFGLEHYNDKVVGWLQGLNYLLVMELLVIALPLLFHIGYGIVILHQGRPEPRRYPFLHNQFYVLQRWSGAGILLFLLMHVGGTRIWGIFDPAIKADLFSHMQNLLSNPAILLVYLFGLILSVFHLCNGLWTFAIGWGLVTGKQGQRHLFIACMALTLPLTAMGLHGIWGFVG